MTGSAHGANSNNVANQSLLPARFKIGLDVSEVISYYYQRCIQHEDLAEVLPVLAASTARQCQCSLLDTSPCMFVHIHTAICKSAISSLPVNEIYRRAGICAAGAHADR